MVAACGAIPSMAWARLVRTSDSSAATWGVTAPLSTQRRPEPRPAPRARASWYSRQRGEVDVVGPVLEQDEAGRVPGQVRGRHLVAQVPGLLWRDRALPVAGGVVGGVGHGPADGELVAGQRAVGGRTVMVSPRARATWLG